MTRAMLPERADSAEANSRRRWLALAVIVAAQFMVVLDVAIVNVALPSIKTDLGFSQTSLQWVVSAYAIFFGGTLLLGGRLADLFGRRRLFIGGLLLFVQDKQGRLGRRLSRETPVRDRDLDPGLRLE